jgi:hypothetical protein
MQRWEFCEHNQHVDQEHKRSTGYRDYFDRLKYDHDRVTDCECGG